MKKTILLLITAAVLSWPSFCPAGWETGGKAGYDSNVDRSIENGKGDALFTVYLSYMKEAAGDRKIDWTLLGTVEGAAYAKYSDLNYAGATIAPGVTLSFGPVWSLNISPFVQGKAVSDSDQSAAAFGVRAGLRQQWTDNFYTGEYYQYTDSSANEDIYSYTENAFGGFIGLSWTRRFFTELSYEYSRGDSFQSIGTYSAAQASGPGRGAQRRYSTSFEEVIIKEKVTRNMVGLTAGYDWSKTLFSVLGYSYTRSEGDLGTADIHFISLGLGYRF
jgi:hypothetical protein